jgi:hypothetical protein
MSGEEPSAVGEKPVQGEELVRKKSRFQRWSQCGGGGKEPIPRGEANTGVEPVPEGRSQ